MLDKIVHKKIEDLIFAEYNPRQLTDDQYRDLKDSITRFGLVDPVLVNKNKARLGIIIGGHQRVKVARTMGIKEVPCIELDLDYDKERELNVRLNKNTGGWDFDVLANTFDIDELIEWGFTENDLRLFDDDYDDEFSLEDGDKDPFIKMTFTLSNEQAEIVEEALKKAKNNQSLKSLDTGNENANGNALWWICDSYDRKRDQK